MGHKVRDRENCHPNCSGTTVLHTSIRRSREFLKADLHPVLHTSAIRSCRELLPSSTCLLGMRDHTHRNPSGFGVALAVMPWRERKKDRSRTSAHLGAAESPGCPFSVSRFEASLKRCELAFKERITYLREQRRNKRSVVSPTLRGRRLVEGGFLKHL